MRDPFPGPATLLAILAACNAPPAPEPATAEVDALGIRNLEHPRPGLVSSGQPTPEQLDTLLERGWVVINLRPGDEDGTGWEEARAARHGARYARIPVAGAEGVTTENARRLADALAEADDAPVLVYCGSGNRVGALLAIKAHELDGATPAEALALGKAAGLTRLEPAVREMLERE